MYLTRGQISAIIAIVGLILVMITFIIGDVATPPKTPEARTADAYYNCVFLQTSNHLDPAVCNSIK